MSGTTTPPASGAPADPAGTGTPPAAPPPAPPPPPPAADAKPTGDEPRFTQAELDARIAERLNREGIADLRDKAKRWDELEEANRSELDKANKRAEEAEAAAKAAEARATAQARAAAITTAAHKLGAVSPDAVLKLLADDAVTPSTDGTFDAAAVEKAVGALLDANTFLKAAPATPPPFGSGPAGPQGTTGTDPSSMSMDDFDKWAQENLSH